MLVPSLLLSRRMVHHKSAGADDLFASFRERPGVVVATWFVLICHSKAF
jgi:hypothetical protein